MKPEDDHKMSAHLAFRVSVVLSLLVPILGATYAVVATQSFSQEWQDLIAWSGDAAIILPDLDGDEVGIGELVGIGLLLVFLLVVIANQVAFFFYWPPSRMIYLGLSIVGCGISPLLGLTVAPPLEFAAYEIGALLGGVALALAFFSPVAGRFETAPKSA